MKVTLRLSTKKRLDGMSEVLLTAKKRVRGRIVTMRAKSGVFVLPVFFSDDVGVDLAKKRIVAPNVRRVHIEAKARLDGMMSAIVLAESDTDWQEVTKDWLQNVIASHMQQVDDKKDREPATFYELAADYIGKKETSERYKQQIWVIVRAVYRYESFVRAMRNGCGGYVFAPEKVTVRDIEDLLDYMRNEYVYSREYPKLFERIKKSYPVECGGCRADRQIQKRGCNILHSQMKRLRSMWRSWNEKGIVANDPFKGFKNVQEHYGSVTYITLAERDAIANVPMPTLHLETQRDIFVAQCRIGCRVSDLMRLTWGHVQGDMIVYVPEKTRNEGADARTAKVPVTDGLRLLMEKYKGVDKHGRLFPCVSAQRYNDAIKEVFTIAGITREVEVRDSLTGDNVMRPLNEIASSHLARRTFIANLYNKVSDPNLIGKMSGHAEGSKAFTRYRNIEDDTLRGMKDLIG